MPGSVPTLLIVDDDPEITSALARGLALFGYDTVTENRADHALARLCPPDQLSNHPPGPSFVGAIIDVMLGSDSGLDLLRTARAKGVTLPVIMLSALSDVEHRAAGLDAGADDSLVKPFAFDELVARLRVQERRAPLARPAPAHLSDSDRALRRAGAQVVLTDREYALLASLLPDPTAPKSRGALFDQLWARDGSSSENVVDVYIGYLRRKLASDDFGFRIKTIRHQGFCLDGVPPQRSRATARLSPTGS